MNKQRAIEGGIFTALGLATIGLSLRYTYMDRFTPGPGLFPFWLGVALTVIGAIMLLTAVQVQLAGKSAGLPAWKSLIPFFVLALLVLTMSWAGSLISITLFTMALVKVSRGQTSWLGTISTGVLVSVAAYVLFERLLGVPLPRGFLGI